MDKQIQKITKKFTLTNTEISNLSFGSFDNIHFFLLRKNKKYFKYFKINQNILFSKKRQSFIFTTFSNLLLTNFLLLFTNWIKFYVKSFKRKLLIKGLGYRCFLSDDNIFLMVKIGFSHLIALKIPKEIKNIIIDKSYIVIEGTDLVAVGNFCKKIKNLKTKDIYKGKGFLYKNEKINLKSIKKN